MLTFLNTLTRSTHTQYASYTLPPPMLISVPPEPVSLSDYRSMGIVDHERDPSEGSRSTTSTSTEYTSSSPHSRDGSERRGHYRGITFDDILPPHLITNAPPPGPEQKQKQQGRSKPVVERRRSTAAPTTSSSSSSPPPPSTKRNYPSVKKQSSSGGKSRFHATARALVRGLSMVKRNSRGGGGYEAV